MEDKKDFDTGMDVGGGDEHKKLVDKFLTIKETPDKDKQELHLKKMLEAFWNVDAEDSADACELSDEEIDFVTAAGANKPNYNKCPYCRKIFDNEDLLQTHMYTHKKI